MSKNRISMKDRVNFSFDAYFDSVMKEDEKLFWSGESLKVNRRGRVQKRIFIITTNRVINVGKRGNFFTNLFSSLIKRQIFIDKIEAITYSIYSNHFVLHVPSQYDYLLCCRYKDEVILILLNLLLDKGINKLPIFFTEKIELLKYCQLEGKKEKKWPKIQPKEMNIEAFEQYIDNKRKVLELNIEKTEVVISKDNEEINEDSFEILKTLGRGFFGSVFLAEKKDNKELYALKVISKADVIKKKFLENIKNEKEILLKIDHPFVVKMEYCFASPNYIFFAMAFKQGGELYRHLKRQTKFEENVARFYAAQIISGLSYLHKSNIMYRDMKPENILLDDKGNIALADFGISKIIDKKELTKSFVGTPEYVAPEIILQKGHNKGVDIWCFGILLYEMIYGVPPFYNKNQNIMLNWIVTIDPFFPKIINISDEMKDLVSKKEPSERIGFKDTDEIKRHIWFKDIDWEQLEAMKLQPPIVPQLKDKFDISNFNKKIVKTRKLKSSCFKITKRRRCKISQQQ